MPNVCDAAIDIETFAEEAEKLTNDDIAPKSNALAVAEPHRRVLFANIPRIQVLQIAWQDILRIGLIYIDATVTRRLTHTNAAMAANRRSRSTAPHSYNSATVEKGQLSS